MEKKILEYFYEIVKVPHCSKDLENLFKFLVDFAKSRSYIVQTDSAKNILISKKEPKLSLQAHYDMVCIGKAPNIQTYIKDGWIYAKDSSLGADNGIAIAIMMLFMDMQYDLEFLFTSDEEIGLIGAKNLEFDLKSKYMLNLDFEDEAVVCIGCAGGADIIASIDLEESIQKKYLYKVSVENLPGGHSGIDIDKNIPNAIQVLANYLSNKDISIALLNGGERRNSIPSSASAIISSDIELTSENIVKVAPMLGKFKFYKANRLIDILKGVKHGVYEFNKELNIPNSSANLAKVNTENSRVDIEISIRAMSSQDLDKISQEIITFFNKFNIDIEEEYKYPSWKPEINKFTKLVYTQLEKIFSKSKYQAIHAGLECGVISQKYPNIKIASIGPTIEYPHSKSERVKIDSIFKTFKAIKTIVAEID